MLVVLLSLWTGLACTQDFKTWSVGFPDHSRVYSPNGRYALINVNNNEEPYHTVFLENRRLKTRRMLFQYRRGVDVLWNPDSESFALTDYGGSDFAHCSVVFVDEKIETIPVLEQLLKRLSVRDQKDIQRNDHLYVQAVQWINLDVLRIKIWGHDSESRTGFERFYRFSRSKSHP